MLDDVNVTPHFYGGRVDRWSISGMLSHPSYTEVWVDFTIKQLGSKTSILYFLESSTNRLFGEHEKGIAVLSALELAKMLREGGLEVKVNDIVVDEK